MVIYTKITVNATDYRDFDNIQVVLSSDQNNSGGSFSASTRNWRGINKDNFGIGDDIQIFADQGTNPPTTKIFRGIIEDIEFSGKEQDEKMIITGRDYTAVLQDITVEPTVFNNTEASVIVTSLMTEFAPSITTTNVDTTFTTIDHIRFNHVNLYDAIKQIAEQAGFFFYIDTDKDLNFKERETTGSGLTFDNTNITKAKFKESDQQLYNQVWVYGGRVLVGTTETFSGDGAGSVFTLSASPHNTDITVDGVIQKGGISEVVLQPESGTNYLIDFDQKKIIFTSGTDIGDSTPANGTNNIVVNYDESRPLVKFARNEVSESTYGKKSKVIVDRSITQASLARDIALTTLDEHKDPVKQGDLEVSGVLSITPGQTCIVDLPNHNVSSQQFSMIEARYTFDVQRNQSEQVLRLRVNKRVGDITDTIKQMLLDIKKIQAQDISASDIFTRLETATAFATGCTSFEVRTRTIGSGFILGHPLNGVLGSPAPSQGGLGQVVLGDSRSAQTIVVSGDECP